MASTPPSKKDILLARYKPGGVHDASQSGERRRVETVAVSVHRREETLRAKRLRRDTSLQGLAALGSRGASRASLGGASEEASEGPSPEADVGAEVRAAVSAAAAHPIGGRAHVEGIRALRQLLSAFDEPPSKEAVEAGAVPLLIAALQPPRMDSTALEGILEAAWALTNLAAGGHAAVRAVLPAAPVLITYLSGDSGLPLAESCAWALGNIAGEDFDFRQALIANGAIRPLAGLLARARRALASASPTARLDESDPALAAATTAAWALSNVLREAGQEVGEFMGIEGAAEAVIYLIEAAPRHLATECAWVMAYLSAAHDAYVERLATLGALRALLARLAAEVEALSQDTPEGRALVTPLLRCVGNLSAGGGAAALSQLLAPEAGPALVAVVGCAQSEHHGVQREAAWVLSNVAGAPGRAGVDAVRAAGAVPVLRRLLQAPFHVRKEAAYALANVAAGGGGASGDGEALNWLFAGDRDALHAMLSLCRSADMDAARLGIQFTEMFLRLIERGPELVEAVDGIDALEAVQFGPGPPELQRMAADLVNRYYGTGEEGMAVEAGE